MKNRLCVSDLKFDIETEVEAEAGRPWESLVSIEKSELARQLIAKY